MSAGLRAADEKPAAKVVKLEASPATIALKGPADQKQVVITAVMDSGTKVNVTEAAQLSRSENLVAVSAARQVKPLLDGKSELTFTFEDQAVTIPVEVTGIPLAKLEAYPAAVTLKGPFDYRQLFLTGTLASGDRVDVTRLAQAQKNNLVQLSGTGIVRSLADGKGELKFTLGGQTAVVPVEVAGAKDRPTVSFVRDVMPTMSKMGCNAGTCHGAQSGKNGFKLSLRGYDPLYDHRALTDDLAGRRFNRAAPDTSLMLLKPAGAVPHIGGVLTQPGEPYYELLRAWIANGVQYDGNSPRVKSIDVFPKNPVMPLIGMKQQMAVLATYTDGSVRDVSAEAFIESSNTEVAKVDKNGLVQAERRGEAAMLARYEGAYAATTMIVMGDRSGYTWQNVPENNYIDGLVYEKLRQVKILPSGLCNDAEFIRRLYLDLTGLPPTADQVRTFVADNRDTKVKRDELIDKLVGSPEYIEHWTNKWSDLLQVNQKVLGAEGAKALRDWIRKAVADNMPYDKFSYAVLTGSGSTLDNPPAAYYKVLRTPDAVMENTTHLFLAVRFNCNKCHDHPFERWTQDQYYHMAAFFAQVNRAGDPRFAGRNIGGSAVEGAVPLVEVISDGKGGEVTQIRTGQTSKPEFPYTHDDVAPATAPRREQLARWVTSRKNQYFAKSYVNRMWSYMLGVGIIEPVDDIRAGNPPSNPKLLEKLTEEFIASNFNVQQLVKTICKSRVYQHSLDTNKWNEDDEINYSHATVRRLSAEVLYDAIHKATGSVSRLPGLPDGSRAAQMIDPTVDIPGGFFQQFGKPPRESACECERSSGVMLGPVLNLINGPTIGDAVKDPNNRIAQLIAKEKDDAKVIEEIFFSIVARKPSKDEIDRGMKALQGNEEEFNRLVGEHDKRQAAVDAYLKQLDARQPAWEKMMSEPTTWTTVDGLASSKGGATLTRQADGSILASGKNPYPEVYTLTAHLRQRGITAIRLEVLPDDSLPGKGPGRDKSGNFVLNEFRVLASPLDDPTKVQKVSFARAQADFSQQQYEINKAIDNNPNTGWAISPQVGKPHVAIFELAAPLDYPDGAVLTIVLDQRFNGKDHNIGKFRLSYTSKKPPITLTGPPEAIVKALAVPADKRTPEQKAVLANAFRALDGELPRLQQDLAAYPRPTDKRLLGAQDLAWALLISKEFLFNH
jgi:hypothetical protein